MRMAFCEVPMPLVTIIGMFFELYFSPEKMCIRDRALSRRTQSHHLCQHPATRRIPPATHPATGFEIRRAGDAPSRREDVYKRQGFLKVHGILGSIIFVKNIALLLFWNADTRILHFNSPLLSCSLHPVSYTHLIEYFRETSSSFALFKRTMRMKSFGP